MPFHFLCKKAEKGRKSKKIDTKFSKKLFFLVCTLTLAEGFVPRKHTFSVIKISFYMKKNESDKAFERIKEHAWRQNKDYVRGITC